MCWEMKSLGQKKKKRRNENVLFQEHDLVAEGPSSGRWRNCPSGISKQTSHPRKLNSTVTSE